VRHARAIALLPGTVTILVPGLIVWGDTDLVAWRAALGGLLIAAGFAGWLWTVLLFARLGRGTLAPWDPTRRLVVEGPYRHVRNPMITAVIVVLLGEALLFGSLGVLVWAVVFFAVNATYFVVVEEPGLERRFGEQYRAYRRAVPRWLPRLSASRQ
jgi:protein-S-isoprenylcysteine O-methyltransferase Ste14